jgi:protein-disulfide isomerase
LAISPPPSKWENEMKRSHVWTLVAAFSVAFVGACAGPVVAAEFTPEQKTEIGTIMKDYLVNNPEVLRAAIEALDKHDKQVEADARQSAVADQAGPLFSSAHQANVGNLKGDATLVEFFDYNCHYCKGALPDMAKLMQNDPNMKLVLKDFPVLGPGSVEAAKVATAVRNQLHGDKFWQFHVKLLGSHGPVGKTEALAVAKDMGVDMDRLNKDIESPDVTAGLDEVMKMADALQINGTPSFVVGQEVVVGAVGYDQLKQKLDSVHKCGHAVC